MKGTIKLPEGRYIRLYEVMATDGTYSTVNPFRYAELAVQGVTVRTRLVSIDEIKGDENDEEKTL